jgi:hypothetical protein
MKATGSFPKPKHFISRLFSAKLLFPSLLLIWFLYFFVTRPYAKQSSSLRGIGSLSSSFDAKEVYTSALKAATTDGTAAMNHLVIVAGHAVVRFSQLATADTADAGWYLLPYQQGQSYPAIIKSHIQSGIRAATADSNAVLIFSGGQTRRDVGPTSEAASYYYVAQEKKWLPKDLAKRVYLEEYARDSFENLLFSVCRFREVQGYYPAKVTVVGFDFKKKRYTELHRRALGLPIGNFTYLGVASPAEFNQQRAVDGEQVAYQEFEKDLYGCSDATLSEKKQKRNPFKRTVPYALACPEIEPLLRWCGPALYDMTTLPWHTQISKE